MTDDKIVASHEQTRRKLTRWGAEQLENKEKLTLLCFESFRFSIESFYRQWLLRS